MPGTRKLRVFLCHASQDKPVVRELYRRLLEVGWIDPWLDEENILPGQDWDLEIEKAVEAADAVLVCLSNNSVTKEGYVQHELRLILDMADYKPEETIFVIPVRLSDCPAPRRLRKWQYVDYFPSDKKSSAYRQLLKSMQLRAESLRLETQGEITKPGETENQGRKFELPQGSPQKTDQLPGIFSKLNDFKVKDPVCEVCHKPFRFLEQAATCASCGARYHKLCGVKLGTFDKYTCLKCGKPIAAKEFRLSAV